MNENRQDVKKLLSQDVLKWIIFGLIIIVVIVLVFGLGILIGQRRARFSYRWAEQYHKNFAGPRDGFFGDWRNFPRGDFIGTYGVFGQIIKIDLSANSEQEATLVIKGSNDVEEIVLVKDNTIIERFRNIVKIADLEVDDYIVVIGEPNDAGQIEAKFIRLLPPARETSFNVFPLPPPMVRPKL